MTSKKSNSNLTYKGVVVNWDVTPDSPRPPPAPPTKPNKPK